MIQTFYAKRKEALRKLGIDASFISPLEEQELSRVREILTRANNEGNRDLAQDCQHILEQQIYLNNLETYIFRLANPGRALSSFFWKVDVVYISTIFFIILYFQEEDVATRKISLLINTYRNTAVLFSVVVDKILVVIIIIVSWIMLSHIKSNEFSETKKLIMT